MPRKRSGARQRVVCQDVRFVEVEFPRPVQPRLVVQFSDGLSLLVENDRAVGLAEVFRLRISPEELKAWTKAKPPHQRSLSRWIRETLNKAAKQRGSFSES